MVTFKINYILLAKNTHLTYKFLDFEETVKDDDQCKIWNNEDLDKYFKTEESIKICFEVFSFGSNRKFYFDLFHGENVAYLFIVMIGKTYQLLFKDINSIEIIIPSIPSDIKITDYDTNNTNDRKRVLMINYPYEDIRINCSNIHLNESLPPNNINKHLFNFSFYDISKGLILSKVYDDEKDLKMKKYIEKNKKIFSLLFSQINKLNKIESEKEYNDKYSCLKTYNLDKFKIHLNFSNNKLKEFSGADIINFEFNKVFSLIILYFRKLVNIQFNEFKKLYNYIFQQLTKIKDDKNLQGYQKILIMEQFLLCATKFKNLNHFIDSNFQYYLFSKAENNSIIYYVKNFIHHFIEDLKDTDKVYYRLIELDAGISYYKYKSFYSFDLKNLDEIKSHLRDMMKDLITFYNNEEDNNNSFCSKHFKYATINIKSVDNSKKLELDKTLKDDNIIEGKRIASKIIIAYFHEIACHIKFGFSNLEYIDWPNKCISNKNAIQTLVPYNIDLKYKNAIRILNENEKSDSGSFFESIFGKVGAIYIKDLLDNINNYWIIIDRPELFLEKLPLFSKYIKYRFIFEHFQLEELSDSNITIEEEIEYMNLQFKKNDIDIEKIEQNDKKIEEEINENENIIQ